MKEEIKNPETCGIYYVKTMEICFVSCKKNAASKNSSVRKAKQNRLMLLLNSVVCGKEKSTFIKNLEHHEAVFNNFDNI